ncbi:hypothetical protein Desor_4817 [Desulfosporosinus orientis DSM 765]|uniref:Uncharacterized protein n=1 Tax=Desulfosporosinus orientis (strain ATCC 19365 / DSM 765 / NCIMB 8382 / VKM B-1628 / Singapore I) TaxID=768706 RepID=G7WHC8_DESOD|nr:hypothetical protein [Desulfosporosinus orientis]AET70218.1 hypothetical protein Desor_4817 [Desulfosporosinus orientis DSM 765]
MWPKRKLQLVASSAAPGIGGVRAILKGVEVDFLEAEPTAKEFGKEFEECWMDRPFDTAISEAEAIGPVTELIYWQEEQESDFWREKALSQGLQQRSIQSLIHTIFEDELILWVSEPTVLFNERPLLVHILNEAGFEPTLLWPIGEENWQCERKQGVHWIMPDSWLEGLVDKSSLGKNSEGLGNKASWVIQNHSIDFYRAKNRHQYIGHLPRWPKAEEEESAAQIIATCIDLGVSWRDIVSALSFLWQDNKRADNLRWNFNDFRWNAGASGEELSSLSAKYLENWWAR